MSGPARCRHEAWESTPFGSVRESRQCADCGKYLGTFPGVEMTALEKARAAVEAVPVAWIWEQHTKGLTFSPDTIWPECASIIKPAISNKVRKLRPLYTHPGPPAAVREALVFIGSASARYTTEYANALEIVRTWLNENGGTK